MPYQLWHIVAASVGTGFLCANLGFLFGGYLAAAKVADMESRIVQLEYFIRSLGLSSDRAIESNKLPVRHSLEHV